MGTCPLEAFANPPLGSDSRPREANLARHVTDNLWDAPHQVAGWPFLLSRRCIIQTAQCLVNKLRLISDVFSAKNYPWSEDSSVVSHPRLDRVSCAGPNRQEPETWSCCSNMGYSRFLAWDSALNVGSAPEFGDRDLKTRGIAQIMNNISSFSVY